MMGIGFPELMIILVIIMIIFGAGKLPEIGSAFGNSIKNFKKSMKDAEEIQEATNLGSTETIDGSSGSESSKVKLPKIQPKLRARKKTRASLYHRLSVPLLKPHSLIEPTVIFLNRFYASSIQFR